jgi:predicted 2-oxoglutarate/Fe(II)-dependent dioxygenase YbiX
MPARDEVFRLVVRKHDDRMDRFAQSIMKADTPELARLKLEMAVRSLPGVSADPHTVPDIFRLMDTYHEVVRLLSEDS